MDPTEVVQRWWGEVWGGDLSVIDEIVAEPYVRHTMDGTKTQTREELKADMVQYFRVLNKPRVRIGDQAVSGSTVWSRVDTEGVNIETEATTRITWIQIHRLDDTGRIAESWTMYSRDAHWD